MQCILTHLLGHFSHNVYSSEELSLHRTEKFGSFPVVYLQTTLNDLMTDPLDFWSPPILESE